MARVKALENPSEILDMEPVHPKARELLGKILDLEKDGERVTSVRLGYEEYERPGNGLGIRIYGMVALRDDFDSLDGFRDYLTSHSIRGPSARKGGIETKIKEIEPGRKYAILWGDVFVEFSGEFVM